MVFLDKRVSSWYEKMRFRWEAVTTGLPGTGLPGIGPPGTAETIVLAAIVKIERPSSYQIRTVITSWGISFPNNANSEQERSWVSIRNSPS
jgi:hypothetical protein